MRGGLDGEEDLVGYAATSYLIQGRDEGPPPNSVALVQSEGHVQGFVWQRRA